MVVSGVVRLRLGRTTKNWVPRGLASLHGHAARGDASVLVRA
jgi:hypothetical protein